MRSHVVAVSLLFLGVLLVYGRTGSFSWVNYDDVDYVLLTEPVTQGLTRDGILWSFSALRAANWHPLTWLSYMLDVELFGLDPGPMHQVNALLHGLTSALVYAFAWQMLGRSAIAFVVAFVFMAHPLHVESVAWIAERKDVLCGLFYVLTLIAYTRYARAPGIARYCVVLVTAALALMSKAMAVTLPLMLCLLDLWPLRRVTLPEGAGILQLRAWARQAAPRLAIAEKIPLFAMSLAVGVVTVLAQDHAIASLVGVSLTDRLMNATVAYATYLRQMLMPVGLAAHYPLHAVDFLREFVPALLVVLALSVAAIAVRRKHPWVTFAWAWYLVTLLPVIGLLQVGTQAHADRYMYLPSLGLLLAVGAMMNARGEAWLRRWTLSIAAVLAFLAGMSWIQAGYWANQFMLHSRMLDISNDSPLAHIGLSNYYLNQRVLDKAQHHAVQAIKLDPGGRFGHYAYQNLGNVYLEQGDYAQALLMYEFTLMRKPDDARTMFYMAIALEKQGHATEAAELSRRAREIDPALRAFAH